MRIVEIVFPIFAIISVGVVYGRLRSPNLEIASQINLHVFIPCLIFTAIIQQPFAAVTDFALISAAVLIHLVPAIFALPIIWLSKQSVQTLLPPAVFANAGNLGLPLFVLAFGEIALAPAVVLFLVMNILQFTVGVRFLDRDILWRRVISQPVLISAVLAILYQLLELDLSQTLLMPIEMLGQVAVPLMLFTLGSTLAGAQFSEWRLGLYSGLMIPTIGVFSALLIILLLPLNDLQQRMLILYGALPPAVLTFIFAQRYNQEPGKVAAVVMIGNMLSVLIIPLTLYFVLPE
ncbi:MAG: AEC family transporter [Gammaproteobacteria bacterium]|nr:MAG: AEC family transporter [Gammaproteobacteria bacterium]